MARWALRLKLLIGGPQLFYTVVFGVVCILLEMFISYARYAAVLKWATLSLFTYVAVVFAAHVPWAKALLRTFVPQFVFNGAHMTAMVALLGTTISPYLFFWQAGQEVEEQRRRHVEAALCVAPRKAGPELARIRIDTMVGMGISNLIALFIIFATAATLNAHGVTEYPDLFASRRSAAACGGRIRVRAVRGGHYRHRHAGRTGAGGIGRLRRQRSVQMDAKASTARRAKPRRSTRRLRWRRWAAWR